MKLFPIAIVAAFAAAAAPAVARNQIRIVGSSTVFPFSTAVAERFGKSSRYKTPVVESTGTGGGLKLFCSGIGVRHSDIVNASRRIKQSEIARCRGNGVTEITEVKIGFDGIVVANSRKGPKTAFTLRHLYLALAKSVPADKSGGKLIDNPYRRWRDIDAGLPDAKIEVLGPPPTSGTRDAFVELALEGGCQMFPAIRALKKSNTKRYRAICHGIREDGAFVEAGENDVLIVQKLVANPRAFGVFGFSFLEQNADRVRGNTVNGVAPEFESISDGSYPVSRSMYVYVKNAHARVVPGIRAFVTELTSERASGPEGYLADKGLISLPDAERARLGKSARALQPMTGK